MNNEPEPSNYDLRFRTARAWRQGDRHGVWFYGTWLFHRYYGFAVLTDVVLVAVCVAVIARVT